MKEKKLKTIIEYINNNPHIFIQGKRMNKKQSIVDQRTYLIFILVSQFACSPNDISKIFKVHRSLYYNILNKITYFLKDQIFINHNSHLINCFPYSEKDIKKINKILKDKFNYKCSALYNIKNILKLKEEDIEKLKNNPDLISNIKKLIKMYNI